MEASWAKFFNKGWDYDKTPSKKECFEAGYQAAIDKLSQPEKFFIKNGEFVEFSERSDVAGTINFYPGKPTEFSRCPIIKDDN